MSVIIKGMQMPKNCAECPFMALANNSDGRLLEFCSVSEMFVLGIETQRDPKCPLIELPPHGRLIEESALKRYAKDVVLANGAKHRCIDATILWEIPTIIESEE